MPRNKIQVTLTRKELRTIIDGLYTAIQTGAPTKFDKSGNEVPSKADAKKWQDMEVMRDVCIGWLEFMEK